MSATTRRVAWPKAGDGSKGDDPGSILHVRFALGSKRGVEVSLGQGREGPASVMASPFIDTAIEAIPQGSWMVHQLPSGNNHQLFHRQSYNDARTVALVADWLNASHDSADETADRPAGALPYPAAAFAGATLIASLP